MVEVKLVKIDGETIHVFRSAMYLYITSHGNSLELDMIVSEVTAKKYKNEENLIIEIELEDGRIISAIMHVKVWSGGLPQLNLYCEVNDIEEYNDFDRVTENDAYFPKLEEGITLEEIRQVEMPYEKVTLKLNLPIDQLEWVAKQTQADLNEMFKEMIYKYWTKKA